MQLDVEGRRVLVRVDFNVPLGEDADGDVVVADDTRIALRSRRSRSCARAARGSCSPRTSGARGTARGGSSLAPGRRAAARADRTRAVTLAPAVVGERGPGARRASSATASILVLENVRFEPGETRTTPSSRAALAELADVYVNDAFGAAHRAHASTEGVAHLLPSAAGRLLEREVETLGEDPRAPGAPAGGGRRRRQGGRQDRRDRPLPARSPTSVLIGGAMCFPFLCAQGHTVGDSLCERRGRRARAPRARRSATEPGSARVDAAGRSRDRRAARCRRRASRARRRRGAGRLDGPRHRPAHRRALRRARSRAPASVFWNGPMGAFELEPFAAGTRAVAEAVARGAGRDRRRRRRLGRGARAASASRARSTTSRPAAARRSSWSRGATLPGVRGARRRSAAVASPDERTHAR